MTVSPIVRCIIKCDPYLSYSKVGASTAEKLRRPNVSVTDVIYIAPPAL